MPFLTSVPPPAPAMVAMPVAEPRAIAFSMSAVPPPPPPPSASAPAVSYSDSEITLEGLARLQKEMDQPAQDFFDQETGEMFQVVGVPEHVLPPIDLTAEWTAAYQSLDNVEKSLTSLLEDTRQRPEKAVELVFSMLKTLDQPSPNSSGRRNPACKICKIPGHYTKTCHSAAIVQSQQGPPFG